MSDFEIPAEYADRHALSLVEIAKHYGVTKQTVKRRVWDGRLPAFRIGRDYRVKPEHAFCERTASLMEMTKFRSGSLERQQVYFIGAEDGPVKIGKAMSPEARLAVLQNAYPYRLSILATVAGGGGVEAGYHRMFAAHRLEGEWFKREPEIMAEIDRLRLAALTE